MNNMPQTEYEAAAAFLLGRNWASVEKRAFTAPLRKDWTPEMEITTFMNIIVPATEPEHIQSVSSKKTVTFSDEIKTIEPAPVKFFPGLGVLQPYAKLHNRTSPSQFQPNEALFRTKEFTVHPEFCRLSASVKVKWASVPSVVPWTVAVAELFEASKSVLASHMKQGWSGTFEEENSDINEKVHTALNVAYKVWRLKWHTERLETYTSGVYKALQKLAHHLQESHRLLTLAVSQLHPTELAYTEIQVVLESAASAKDATVKAIDALKTAAAEVCRAIDGATWACLLYSATIAEYPPTQPPPPGQQDAEAEAAVLAIFDVLRHIRKKARDLREGQGPADGVRIADASRNLEVLGFADLGDEINLKSLLRCLQATEHAYSALAERYVYTPELIKTAVAMSKRSAGSRISIGQWVVWNAE